MSQIYLLTIQNLELAKHFKLQVLQLCLLFSLVCLSACGSGSGTGGSSLPPSNVIYVKISAIGNETGRTWPNAYTSIQDALAATGPTKNELWVAAGTYLPVIGSDRSATFQLLNGVSIYGGFAGNESSRSARNPTTNITILSGNINNNLTSADNSYHVVTGVTGGLLDGFTIRDGNANGAGVNAYGAGIYNSAADPIISNCIITNNTAATRGAGIYNQSAAAPTITDCLIQNNATSSGDGGGMFNSAASPVISRCTFTANTSSAGGAGLYNVSGSNATLANCLFYGNDAGTNGGAVYNSGSDPIFKNCTLSDNNAVGSGASFSNWSDSDPVLTNCIVWANELSNVDAANIGEEFHNNDTSSVAATYTLTAYAFAGTGNMTGVPLFTTPGSVFTLQNASPAIDVGTNSGVSSTDLVGNSRVVNGPNDTVTAAVVDMGCYENQTVGALPLLAPPIINN